MIKQISRIGSQLRCFREAQGYPLRALAPWLGCSASTLSRIERGARKPSLAVAFRIEAATGIAASAWLGETPGETAVGPGPCVPLKPERVQKSGA